MIKTSIIVPVYNTAKYLKDCFDSIFSQTQKEIEVITINDGSTDDSLNVLEEINREHPELIIISQENKGLGAARNKGMEIAKGEFIYFIDSDDCIVNTAMDTCYRYAKNNQLDIVMFDAEVFGDIEHEKDAYDRSKIIKEQVTIMSGEEYAYKYWSKAFYPSACLIYTKAQFMKENNLKFIPGIYYEDNEFHCKSIPYANRIMYIPQALYMRRIREASITASSFDIRHARDYLFMIQAIDKQKHTERMRNIIYEIKLSFLRTLYMNSVKNNLMQEYKFTEEFFETALQICGGVIENINDYYGIELLYLISKVVSERIISDETGKRIQNRKKEIVNTIFSEIPLQLKDKRIGIYGTGKHTDMFLNVYQENVGEIRAEIIPIDSNVITGEKKYRNHDVININDIGMMQLECIVVSSLKYEQEICETIRRKYDDRFRIVRLLTDLHF